MTTATTRPCPADQQVPIRRPASLAELALAQGVDANHVGRYLASCAVPSFRIVATVIALQAVAL